MHKQIYSFWFEALCQDWFKDFISNSNLFDIWYENDLNSIQCQANPQMSWAIVMSAPNRGDLQSYHWNWSNRITNHILYCTYLYYSQPNPSIWTCLWQMAGTSLLRSLVLSMKVTNFAWFANPEGANRSRGSHGTTDRVSSQVCHFMTYFFTRLA